MATIKWNGDQIMAKMSEAAKLGIDKTMANCVHDAAANHPAYPPASEPYERYANRTGFETGSIHIPPQGVDGVPGAHMDGLTAVGHWGAYGNYSLFLEIGTSVSGPTATDREIAGGGDMEAIPDPEGPKMAPRPFLRPAADREYPLLALRIGAAFRGQRMP